MPSAALTIDVVIPTYGGWEITERCLELLRAESRPHRVIVVDNASPDETVQRVRAGFPAVELVALPANVGFAGASNRGIAAGDSDIVVLLNNDVFIEPGFLDRLVAPLERDPDLGSAVPVLQRTDGSIDNVGLSVDATLSGFPRHQSKAPDEALDTRPRLLGPSGAAAAYRRAALADVGLLDEHIFMYQEDLDLALRLWSAGWLSEVAPEARGVHLGSASAGRRSAWQRQTSGFARGYLLRKYGVFTSRAALRALATELVVAAGDALLSHDLESLSGRVRGWRAARRAERHELPRGAVERSIGFVESLRLRRADDALADPAARVARPA